MLIRAWLMTNCQDCFLAARRRRFSRFFFSVFCQTSYLGEILIFTPPVALLPFLSCVFPKSRSECPRSNAIGVPEIMPVSAVCMPESVIPTSPVCVARVEISVPRCRNRFSGSRKLELCGEGRVSGVKWALLPYSTYKRRRILISCVDLANDRR